MRTQKFGIIIITLSAVILHKNQTASELFGKGLTFSESNGQSIKFNDLDADDKFKTALSMLRIEPFKQVKNDIVAYSNNNTMTSMVTLVPFEKILTHKNKVDDHPSQVMLLIRNDDTIKNTLSHVLIFDFGLTDSELLLALSLVNGHSLQEFAEHESLSIHTVRAKIKKIFLKTHTKNQAHLLSKLSKYI